jgi:hypothetical protein
LPTRKAKGGDFLSDIADDRSTKRKPLLPRPGYPRKPLDIKAVVEDIYRQFPVIMATLAKDD